MNFTDVDDRTIIGAQKAGMELRAYTDQYIAMFREDALALGLEQVEETPRATDEANLQAMADLIGALERNGHTYVSDGSIYFKISTLPAYGKLAHLDHEGMKPGARVDSDNYAKEDARDFVLWKATKPDEPTWTLVDPPGRPGWHLECSAMALRLLGEPPIDIHAGGIDLIFPHHENEIAQSEGATGKPFSLLGARRVSALRRAEDVEVARQHRTRFGRDAKAIAVGGTLSSVVGALRESVGTSPGPDLARPQGSAAAADRLPAPAETVTREASTRDSHACVERAGLSRRCRTT
jgi:hypothetical protein